MRARLAGGGLSLCFAQRAGKEGWMELSEGFLVDSSNGGVAGVQGYIWRAHVGPGEISNFPPLVTLGCAAVIIAPWATPRAARRSQTGVPRQAACGQSRWHCGSIGPIAKTRHDSAIQQFHSDAEVLSVAGRHDVVCGSPGSTARACTGRPGRAWDRANAARGSFAECRRPRRQPATRVVSTHTHTHTHTTNRT